MKQQILVSLEGTREELVGALRRIADRVEAGAMADEGRESPFLVIDTSRPPINLTAVLRAEESGILDVYGEPDPWSAAAELEGERPGGL